MPFFGRDRETHVAENTIDARSGSACLFVGEPGIGKTRWARQIAARHDTVVVSASPSERMWPYSGLSATAAALGGARGAAIDRLLARGRDWPEHLLAEEISRTLHLVHDEPAVLVIDDLDEMDSGSVTVLSFVFSRLRGTGLTVIATADSDGDRHDFTGMLHTRVQRLSFDESVDLARSVLGPGTAQAVLYTVAEFTGGDPGSIVRVRLTPREAAGDDPLPLPLRVTDDRARRRRDGRLAGDPRVTSLLDLLSVGPVFSFDRLTLIAQEQSVDLDALIDDGLVAVHGEFARIADPARRLRHHASLSADERRRLHAQAAAAHEETHPATFLWHTSFGAPDADREPLLCAAVDLASGGDHLGAIEFAERAMAGDLADDVRCRHLVDLGDALVLQGHDVQGRHYLRRAGRAAEPTLRARRPSRVCVRPRRSSTWSTRPPSPSPWMPTTGAPPSTSCARALSYISGTGRSGAPASSSRRRSSTGSPQPRPLSWCACSTSSDPTPSPRSPSIPVSPRCSPTSRSRSSRQCSN
ncbi:AAA family ATPase [Microbacterium testaceum]|uniref:AAA family ATPase n=1 Tax=Microbacterium testaceum TaxID=2033 RepID=UPI002AC4994F|nr:AAA family ATPase [Microbacterium testaceum]MDZ5145907.1 AAA family ATPase [Microbacterium testaceum]